ncbi:MAG: hypothetical protein JWM58_947 [Rhizobium sp.]|nr:hypothetical protein [Rhizobium sp.]
MRTAIFAASLLAMSATAATQAYSQDVIVVPDGVDRYVTEQPYDDTVIMDDGVTVGEPLNEGVVVREIPDNGEYGYVVTNKRRIIVEPKTRKVIRIYD